MLFNVIPGITIHGHEQFSLTILMTNWICVYNLENEFKHTVTDSE